MINRNQLIILYCTAVAFAILYAPQPLLPVLAQEWGRSLSDVALLTTVSMLPLAVAPLVYGYFLERFSSRVMLINGFTLLLITQVILSTAPAYSIFITLRAIQGLLLPAIFTSLMTYSASIDGHDSVRRNISFYIAATIFGSLCGRVVAGMAADFDHWQTAFWIWSFFALLAVVSLFRLDSDPRGTLVKISMSEIKSLIAKPVNQIGLLAVFLLFFVTSAMMNFLPFRVLELEPDISTAALSLVYSGYLIGMVIAVFSTRLVGLFGSEKQTLLITGFLYLSGCALFIFDYVSLYYFAMFVLMAGMFSIHSVLSAYLNHLEPSRKAMMNGLYVSSYYSGGAFGSFFPGLIYQSFGWLVFCLILMSLILLLIGLINKVPSEN